MRFSNPKTASRLRRPISESTTATFLPIIARAVPRFAVVVVLPTPPFPDVMVITRLSICVSMKATTVTILRNISFAWRASVDPRFDDDLAVPNSSDFRARLRFISLWRAREQVGNTQLYRSQQKRTDYRLLIVGIARVYHAAQHAPHDDITTRHNLRAGVDITQHNDIAAMMNSLSRSHCPAQEQGIIRFAHYGLSILRLLIDHLCSRQLHQIIRRLTSILLYIR